MDSCILKLLLLLLLIQHGNSGSIVKYLPGFEGPLPFELETGYIGVGEADEEQMFYYFIKSESNPKDDPVLIWLSGGPGCSSLSGFLLENGPLTFKTDTDNTDIHSLISTTYSWSKVANIIYLDQPVGTGFSYSKKPLVDLPSDTGSARQVAEFVRKWLDNHHEYFSNPFYVAGNSYAGMVVPAIVQEISNGNCICCKPPINLQGYVLGNPVTTEYSHNYNFRIPFAHGMALISNELYESMKKNCGGNYGNVDPLNTECLELVEEFEKCVSGIDSTHIIGSKCMKTSLDRNTSYPSEDCITLQSYRRLLVTRWANEERVRKALQMEKGSIGEWIRCDRQMAYKNDIESSVPHHKNNSIEGYRSLIFSGDHDIQVPFLATQAWITSLNYSIIDDWRPWKIHNLVVGYTRTYANKMTFATVKGGGHTLGYTQEESSVMFKRWISGQPL